MAKRRNDHMNLGDALQEFIKENHLEKGMDRVNASNAWHSLMGNGITTYTSKVELKGTILYVSLTSSVLREELSYGKEKIINMMNEELGKELIKQLVLR